MFYPFEIKKTKQLVALLKLCTYKTLCKIDVGHKAHNYQIGQILLHLMRQKLFFVICANEALMEHAPLKLQRSQIFSCQSEE